MRGVGTGAFSNEMVGKKRAPKAIRRPRALPPCPHAPSMCLPFRWGGLGIGGGGWEERRRVGGEGVRKGREKKETDAREVTFLAPRAPSGCALMRALPLPVHPLSH